MLRYAVKLAGLSLLVAQSCVPAAAVAQPYKLRVATVGVPPSMHTLYMQVAFEEGIYRRNGLAVDELVPLAAGPLVTQALDLRADRRGRDRRRRRDQRGQRRRRGCAGGGGPERSIVSYVIAVQPEIKSLKDLVGQAVRDLAAGCAFAISAVPGARPRRHRAQHRDMGSDRWRERAAPRAGQQPGQGRAAAS